MPNFKECKQEYLMQVQVFHQQQTAVKIQVNQEDQVQIKANPNQSQNRNLHPKLQELHQNVFCNIIWLNIVLIGIFMLNSIHSNVDCWGFVVLKKEEF